MYVYWSFRHRFLLAYEFLELINSKGGYAFFLIPFFIDQLISYQGKQNRKNMEIGYKEQTLKPSQMLTVSKNFNIGHIS
jgi:hypothetical protein